MPYLSVIVPIYNVEDYLGECIDSILSQTYTDFELILVDDGSTDACPALCDEYAAKDQRIQVIHKENGGLSDARNTGIEAAKGEFLIFLDSDDWWVDGTVLAKIADLSVGADVVYFGRKDVSGDEIWEDPVVHRLEKCYPTGIAFMDDALRARSTFPWLACLYAFNSALLKEQGIRFPVGRVYEDTATTYKVLLAAKKVSVLKENCYCYRQRREGRITGKASLKSMEDRIFASKTAIADIVQRKNLPESFKKRLLNNFGMGFFEVMRNVLEVERCDRKELFSCLKDEQSMLQYVYVGKFGIAAKAMRLIGICVPAYFIAHRKERIKKQKNKTS